MKSFIFVLLVLFSSASYAQNSCKMLLSQTEGAVAVEPDLASLRQELAEISSLVNMRQLNVQTEQFQLLSQNLAEKLLELSVKVDKSSNQTIKSNFNSAVLKAMALMNVDDFQVGFIKNSVQSLSLPTPVALNLIVDSAVEDQYSLLTQEFLALVSTEIPPEFTNLFSHVQTREQFEIIVHSVFSGQASPELVTMALSIENSLQAEAFVLALNTEISPVLLQSVLSIYNEHQLEVMKVALEYLVTESSLYLEVIPSIETDEQASNVISMIRARQFD